LDDSAGLPEQLVPEQPVPEWLTAEEPLPAADEAAPAEQEDRRSRQVAARLAVWLFFGVAFSLLPLIVRAIKGEMNGSGASLEQILSGGDMFIIGAVTAASGVGELISAIRGRALTLAHSIGAAFLVLVSICNSVAYATAQPSNPHTIAVASYISFAITYISTGACVALAAR
jgi:hypothetical protein